MNQWLPRTLFQKVKRVNCSECQCLSCGNKCLALSLDFTAFTMDARHSCEYPFLNVFFFELKSFRPVFDSINDTFDALHERSPFAVNCICMVAARVRDGGGLYEFVSYLHRIFMSDSTGKPSDVYKKCLEEVRSISCATLFLPVTRVEAIQAMSKYS
jgi:hypothetical protein